MTRKELVELFIEEALKASTMQQFSIPPELLPLFIGVEGFYPLWLVTEKLLNSQSE